MTLEVLRNSSPKSLSILRDITIGDKAAMNYALNVARQGNIIGADDEFDDIMKKENATDILAYIKTIMDNYDTIHHTHADRYRRFDETIANFIEELDAAMKGVGYYNNDDAMTDYFDRAFYIDINIGNWQKPYVYTGA